MKILSWGSNSHGQLGQGIECEQLLSPTKVKIDAKVRFITGGGRHTVILTDENEVFVCGDNSKGQLGIPLLSLTPYNQFQSIRFQCKILKVACGWDFTLALTENCDVFGWGSNSFGQLGVSFNKISFSNSPIKVFEKKVSEIAVGLRHSSVITLEGSIFVAGCGRKGQLGLKFNDCPPVKLDKFTEVKGIKNSEEISCGECHSFARTTDNVFYSWGNNRYGQLGLNPVDVPFSLTPTIISLPIGKTEKCQIFSGWAHNCVLTNSGKLITWGRNDLGQLGEEKFDNWKPSAFTKINKEIKQVALGSHHTLVLTKDNNVFAWGWNEHGNCGNGDCENIDHPYQITGHEKVELIGSGAAHCFLYSF